MAKLTKEQREARARAHAQRRDVPDPSRVQGLQNSLKNLTDSLKQASTETQKPFIELHDEFRQVQDGLEAQGKKFSSTAKIFSRSIDELYDKARNASAKDIKEHRQNLKQLLGTARQGLQGHELKAVEDTLHKLDVTLASVAKARKHHVGGVQQSWAMRHEEGIKGWGKAAMSAPMLQRWLIDKPLAKHRQKTEGAHQSRERSADWIESLRRALRDELRYHKNGGPDGGNNGGNNNRANNQSGNGGNNSGGGSTGQAANGNGASTAGQAAGAQPNSGANGQTGAQPNAAPNQASQSGQAPPSAGQPNGTLPVPQPPIHAQASNVPLDVDWDSIKASTTPIPAKTSALDVDWDSIKANAPIPAHTPTNAPFPAINALLPDAKGPQLHTFKPKPAAAAVGSEPQPASAPATAEKSHTEKLNDQLDAIIQTAHAQETDLDNVQTDINALKTEQGSAQKEQTDILREILHTLTIHFHDQDQAAEMAAGGSDETTKSKPGAREKAEELVGDEEKGKGKAKGKKKGGPGSWLKKLMKGGGEAAEGAEGAGALAEGAEGAGALAEGAEGAGALGGGAILATGAAIVGGAVAGVALGKALEPIATPGMKEANEKKDGMSALDWKSKFAEWMDDDFSAGINLKPAWYQPTGMWARSIDSSFEQYSKKSPGSFVKWLFNKYPKLAEKTFPDLAKKMNPVAAAAPITDAAKTADASAVATVDKAGSGSAGGTAAAAMTPPPLPPDHVEAVTTAVTAKTEQLSGAAPEPSAPEPVNTTDLPLKERANALKERSPLAKAASAVGNAVKAVPRVVSKAVGIGGGVSQRGRIDFISAGLANAGMNEKEIAATIGNVGKETGDDFKTKTENTNYAGKAKKGETQEDADKRNIARVRTIFKGKRTSKLSDSDLLALMRNPDKFAEAMYGKDSGAGLGNTEVGDGLKFKGRGYIQITGRGNYAEASKAIFNDDRLLKNPDLVNEPGTAEQVLAWWMKKHGRDMAQKMGVDLGHASQADVNLVYTSAVAGQKITRGAKDKDGKENYLSTLVDKVDTYSALAKPGATPGAPAAPTTVASANPPALATNPASTPGVRLAKASQDNAAMKTTAALKPVPPITVAAAAPSVNNSHSTTNINAPVSPHNTENTFQRTQQKGYVST